MSIYFLPSNENCPVLNYINNERQAGREINVPDLAASFQESIMEVIADKSIAAAVEYDSNKVVVAGGVAANSRLKIGRAHV